MEITSVEIRNEHNKIIADFMSEEPKEVFDIYFGKDFGQGPFSSQRQAEEFYEVKEPYIPDWLKIRGEPNIHRTITYPYYSDWNELMKVVIKIESEEVPGSYRMEIINRNQVEVVKGVDGDLVCFIENRDFKLDKFGAVYQAVLETIEDINKGVK